MAEKKKRKKSADSSKKKMGLSDEISYGRRMKLEEGVDRAFDMPKEMAEEVSSSFSFAQLAEDLREKNEDDARKVYSEFGRSVMEKVIELADGKYLDRTGEMVEMVAKQTNIHFPHRIGRYAELSVLSLRPQDKWNVTLSTTKEMRIREYSCAMNKALSEAGINLEGLPCGASCIAGFIEAARSASIKMRIAHTAKLPEAGYCEFTFYPL
jgi:uncharacterized protein YoaH (UPF0181 family)